MPDPVYKILKFDLPADQWTPIVSPIFCSSWGLRNASGGIVLLRTDQNDANTEDTLDGGSWELCVSQTEEKFYKGSTLLYARVQAPGIPGLLVGRFVD
jgi:hypothetical protein